MPLQPDQTILNGRYHIQRQIGEGGFARVWLAEDTVRRLQVAIKEPLPGLTGSQAEELAERYASELRYSGALFNAEVPNTIRVITVETWQDTSLLVMEYCAGGSLKDRLDAGGLLPVDEAVRITLELLAALEVVHEKLGLVHRDIKPANILFTGEGKVRLADFGLAQTGESGRSLGGLPHPGSPPYMSPEQEEKTGYLPRTSDLFSVGCVLFEALTGKLYKRVTPGVLASGLRPEVPDWLDAVLAKALVEDPWGRYDRAASMAAALSASLDESKAKPAREEADHRRQEVAMTPLSRAPKIRLHEGTGIEFVRIPAGPCLIGGRGGGSGSLNAGEPRVVHVPEFWLARTPVTNAQYRRFTTMTAYRKPDHWVDGRIPSDKQNHPVVNISWKDALAFCRWAGLRLPSAEEWEKAARGPKGHTYPWGERAPDAGLCNFDSHVRDTTPVDRYPRGASYYGLLDMAGNVLEWCQDWYGDRKSQRVLRGGAWFSGSWLLRADSLSGADQNNRTSGIGFRPARDALR